MRSRASAKMNEDNLLTQLNTVYNDLTKSSTPHPYNILPKTFETPSGNSRPPTQVGSVRKRSFSDSQGKDSGEVMPKKKKRYTWSDDLHRKFMACIFDIGLINAKPKTLLNLLQPIPEGLTTEHIKSHLQKYRHNCQKTKKLFLQQYEVAKDISVSTYKGKALNPGHHAYPFAAGDNQLSISTDRTFKTEDEAVDPPSTVPGSSRSSPIVGHRELLPLNLGVHVNSQPIIVGSASQFGPGKLVFFPEATDSASLAPQGNPPSRSSNGEQGSISPRRSRSQDLDEYTERMEQQLSTQQIIQAQRSRIQHVDFYNNSPPMQPQGNQSNQPARPPVSGGSLTMSPLLKTFDHSDEISLSFLDGSSTGDWHSLADGFNCSNPGYSENMDQVFKFLEDE